MALKPIGIEDNNTFPGRVGTALSNLARAAVADDLAGKASSTHTHAYTDITGKPTSFTPSAHTHTTSQVTGLDTSLNAKVDKTSLVYLTQAQYTALGTKDPNTTYFITG